MFRDTKMYSFGLVAAMLLGMIIAACAGAVPTATEAEAPAAEAEAETEAAAEAEGEAEAEAEGETGHDDASTLEGVMEAGVLKCGTGAGATPGFAFIEEDGSWAGFNVDFCKAFAAATIGDAEAIEPVVTTGTTRFPILQTGDADVLSNNTTWTSSRDTALGFDFVPTGVRSCNL